MDCKTLQQQNLEFSGTNGVSQVNRSSGFFPAFRDESSGRVEFARFRNGEPAPMHLICGLPEEWAIDHDEYGSICRVRNSVIAGFVRDGIFYTRQEADDYRR
jgi:hypothetical protein